MKEDGRDNKKRSRAGPANLRGGIAVGAFRGGIDEFRPRLGNFLGERLLKKGRPLRRHGCAGHPVSVVVRAELQVGVDKAGALLEEMEVCRAPHVRKTLSEEHKIRNEVAPREPKPCDLDEPPGLSSWIKRLFQRQGRAGPIMPIDRALRAENLVPLRLDVSHFEQDPLQISRFGFQDLFEHVEIFRRMHSI